MKRKTFYIWFLFVYFLAVPKSLDASVRIDPSPLGVQNGKLGTRFNFDFQFTNPSYKNRQSSGIYTGVLGTENDNYDKFVVATFSNRDSSVFSFYPGGENVYYPYKNVSMSLGLTWMKLIGYHKNYLEVAFTQINPFSPTSKFDQPENLINTLPFFIQKISVKNISDSLQSGYILISHSDGFEINQDSLSHNKVLLMNGENDKNGIRALAVPDTLPDLSYEIGDLIFDNFNRTGKLDNSVLPNKAQGGFSWKFRLQPGEEKEWIFIYAGYYAGQVMTDKRFNPEKTLKFYYTKNYHSIYDVLRWVTANRDIILNKTNKFELLLKESFLTEEEKFTIAFAFHSYFPNTFLLCDENNSDYRYYVWEGSVKYISTLDVAYDASAFEGFEIPWALKMQLEEWSQITETDDYGVYFPHDLGYYFEVTPHQAYDYLGSKMGVEENCDYLLLLYWYWKQTQDDSFLLGKLNTVKDIISSLKNRDTNNDGIVDKNAFFTTVDQKMAVHGAAENSYIAVKEIASFLAASEFLEFSGDTTTARAYKNNADSTISTLVHSPVLAGNEDGHFPTILYYGKNLDLTDVWNFYLQNDYCGNFPDNWNSYTIMIPEGLLYLILTKYDFSSLSGFMLPLMTSDKASFTACNKNAKYLLFTSEDLRTWFSKLFNHELINNYLSSAFPDYPTYKVSSLKDAFYMLSEKADQGYSDAWEGMEGDLRGLSYYPRGINAFSFLKYTFSGRNLPEIPLKINCGGDEISDWKSDYFDLGVRKKYSTIDSIKGTGTLPQEIFRYESYGPDGTGYEIPVENGEYKVTFYFSEIYLKPGIHDGSRIFDVAMEDSVYISHLNIFEKVRADSALKEGPFFVNVKDGNLTIVGLNHQGTNKNNKFSGIVIEYADRPNLYNVSLQIFNTTATISWNTDLPTIGQIAYGKTDTLGHFSQIDSSFAYYHERHLTSLIPFTAYFYKIVCWDTTGVRGFTKINEFQTSGDSSVFSVNLISFSLIRLEYDKIRLIWKTEFEREMYGFEIQRSEDNTHFKKIGFIKASGSGKAIHLYQFTDSKVKQYPAFYRLKLISDNGPDDYSEIIKISSVFPQKFTLGVNYPNPFTDKTKLTFFVPKKFLKQNAKVVIFNVNGQAVFEKKLTNLNSENEFVWNGDDNNYRRLPSGIYFLLLKLNGKKLSRKIVLVR